MRTHLLRPVSIFGSSSSENVPKHSEDLPKVIRRFPRKIQRCFGQARLPRQNKDGGWQKLAKMVFICDCRAANRGDDYGTVAGGMYGYFKGRWTKYCTVRVSSVKLQSVPCDFPLPAWKNTFLSFILKVRRVFGGGPEGGSTFCTVPNFYREWVSDWVNEWMSCSNSMCMIKGTTKYWICNEFININLYRSPELWQWYSNYYL